MKKYLELLYCCDKILDDVLKEAPLSPPLMTNTLVDSILKKTLSGNDPEELINKVEAVTNTSIICRWYKLDPFELNPAMRRIESSDILHKCELFIAKMREDYDHGEA